MRNARNHERAAIGGLHNGLDRSPMFFSGKRVTVSGGSRGDEYLYAAIYVEMGQLTQSLVIHRAILSDGSGHRHDRAYQTALCTFQVTRGHIISLSIQLQQDHRMEQIGGLLWKTTQKQSVVLPSNRPYA